MSISIILAVVLILMVSPAGAQVQTSSGQPSIQEFFTALVERYSPSSLPGEKEIDRIETEITNARDADISEALPSISRALAHRDDEVKIIAARAFLWVALRPNSAALLESYIRPIGGLLFSPDKRLQRTTIAIFAVLKPYPPPPGIVPPLVEFLKQTGQDTTIQASAVSDLVRSQPEAPEVIQAVEEFMSRPFDARTRVMVLYALQTSRVKDPRIVASIVRMLDFPDKTVKLESIKTLRGMGKDALRQAEPRLKQLGHAPDESVEVKVAAEEAIQAIGR